MNGLTSPGLKISALFSAAALSIAITPVSAPAQTAEAQIAEPSAVDAQTTQPSSDVDNNYLTALYTFLESRDTTTHTMATQTMSPEDNVWAAHMFCRTFDSGVTPTEAFAIYTDSAINQAAAQGVTLTEEMAFAVGLYGGTVMNLGSAYYCPQHQTAVQQALQSL